MGIYDFYRTKIFPRILDWSLDNENVESHRRLVLKNVSGATLEIGFGSGLNLPHYPPHIKKLTIVEPNAGMNALALRRINKSPIEVTSHHLSGENLPEPDDSFDSVVSTWTLCSIDDVDTAVKEILRVLKPGGGFYFLEHGLAENERTGKWQTRLTPLNMVIADGCRLDRDIWRIVENAGLELTERERVVFKNAPGILGRLYLGKAVKK
ncbi:MAG: class I SAM-dependent methyltransferase [Nitrospinae bacterium]|nr:class I SAM-dependent methyltransferase [Nitrospinota bacterium]